MMDLKNLVTQAVGSSGMAANAINHVAAAVTSPGPEEKFGQMGMTPQSATTTVSPPSLASQIISVLCTVFAVYLLYRCSNKLGRVSIPEIIAAICCTPCYIAFRLAKPC